MGIMLIVANANNAKNLHTFFIILPLPNLSAGVAAIAALGGTTLDLPFVQLVKSE